MNVENKQEIILLGNKKYEKEISTYPLHQYLNKEGWKDTVIGGENLIFSYRNGWYTPAIFTEKFHVHECYELIFYLKGDVEYFNESTVIKPSPRMVLWFKPGQMHATKLIASSQLERYVLHFYADFFKDADQIVPLMDFIHHSAGTHMILSESKYSEIAKLLKKAEEIIKENKPYSELVLKSILIEIFYALNSLETKVREGETITGPMGEVKKYIDDNYATITSVSEIAEHFFYSREHLSRKFKEDFNMSVANYLTRRRIAESLAMLETTEEGVTEVAYAVGYHSQSAFIDAFKKNMHCLPSEYRLKHK